MGAHVVYQVFLDVGDMVDYNIDLLNRNDLSHSFFHLDKSDPTVGFSFDASSIFGPTYPPTTNHPPSPPASTPTSPQASQLGSLYLRLLLGSHLARYLRHQLEEQRGYTATVGISTSKLLSKLVGNVNKPKNQTTLVPLYVTDVGLDSNVIQFMDAHDIGKVPGIGFKLAQKLRAHVLGRAPNFDAGLIYGGTKENVTVRDVRLLPGMGPDILEAVLQCPGSMHGIGGRVWGLINGVDDTEVGKARSVPRQISIEDSYIRMDTFEEVKKELTVLAGSLIRRMHMDLCANSADDDVKQETEEEETPNVETLRWLAHPRTLRLSTRPRPLLNADGTRSRTFNRISRSCPMPSFALSLTENVDSLAERLVQETLVPCFRKLHPEKSGWNLSLVNIAVTNMAETAADSKDSKGRDIGRMFKTQEMVLRDWKIEDRDMAPSEAEDEYADIDVEPEPKSAVGTLKQSTEPRDSSLDVVWEPSESLRQDSHDETAWDSEEEVLASKHQCGLCGMVVPEFAAKAHERFHALPE